MVHDHFLSINYENLKRIQKLFFYPVFLFVLPRVRLRDAWCLPEVCEKPCGLWQVQNVLQEPSHGRLLSGRHRGFFLFFPGLKLQQPVLQTQVPEMDETYAEDSFVVSSEVEEVGSSEDETEDVELMPEASYIDGRRQYATRRRVFLHKVRAGAKSSSEQRAEVKAKHTRIIRVNDSSEEEKSDVEDERSSERVKCDGARPEPCRMQPETSSSSLSRTSTVSSRVSLLSKAQRSLTAEEDKKER